MVRCRNTFLFAKCSSSRPNAFCTGINDSAIAIREIKVRKSHAGRLRGEVPHHRRVRQILPPGQSVADRAITCIGQTHRREKQPPNLRRLHRPVQFLSPFGVSHRRSLATYRFLRRSICRRAQAILLSTPWRGSRHFNGRSKIGGLLLGFRNSAGSTTLWNSHPPVWKLRQFTGW